MGLFIIVCCCLRRSYHRHVTTVLIYLAHCFLLSLVVDLSEVHRVCLQNWLFWLPYLVAICLFHPSQPAVSLLGLKWSHMEKKSEGTVQKEKNTEEHLYAILCVLFSHHNCLLDKENAQLFNNTRVSYELIYVCSQGKRDRITSHT